MDKLLVICGPTATGKTTLALSLAQKFSGELVSADSRQVYKRLNIGTGKELPRQATPQKEDGFLYYKIKNQKIWGYDLVNPKKEFSVGQYLNFASKIIPNIQKRNKLPILVGGTGLYIQAVVDGIETASVPKKPKLRKVLEKKSVKELFEILAQLDPIKASSMNSSDRNNPRRLVRAIEVAQYGNRKTAQKHKKYKTCFIGLKTNPTTQKASIKKRVEKRVKDDASKEVKTLLGEGVKWTSQSMQAMGYKQWQGYFNKTKSIQKVKNDWAKDEVNYAKRQITWFKKDKRINWFDIQQPKWQEKVEDLVKTWYSKN